MGKKKASERGRPKVAVQVSPREEQEDTDEQQVTTQRTSLMVWAPAPFVAFVFLLVVRVLAARCTCVDDCDEVYNYWEPLHYLLYGFGQQTWEYAPEYALRSYAYLMPSLFVAKACQAVLAFVGFEGDKTQVWLGVKMFWAVVCAVGELRLYQGLTFRFNRRVGGVFLLLSSMSAGMFTSSSALLPSSTAMILVLFVYAAWLKRQWHSAIFLGLVAVTGLAWPFVAVLFVPLAVDCLHNRMQKEGGIPAAAKTVVFAVASLAGLLLATTHTDSAFYGRTTSPTLNIIKYNVVESGDELYGAEAWTYYAKNLFLNTSFSIVFALLLPCVCGGALLFMPALLLGSSSSSSGSSSSSSSSSSGKDQKVEKKKQEDEEDREREEQEREERERVSDKFLKAQRSTSGTRLMFASPLFLWLALMFSKAHKEERFLYPVYPLIFVSAALMLDFTAQALEALGSADEAQVEALTDGDGEREEEEYRQMLHKAQQQQQQEEEEEEQESYGGANEGRAEAEATPEGDRSEPPPSASEAYLAALNAPQRPRSLLYHQLPQLLCMYAAFFSACLGMCRSSALVRFYGAPCNVYKHAFYTEFRDYWGTSAAKHQQGHQEAGEAELLLSDVTLCVGGEWFRFPSSFFLPSEKIRLTYLRSSFHGQLPQPFSPNGTAAEPLQPFNDQNKEEASRYGRLSDCDYVVELVLPDRPNSDGTKSVRTSDVMHEIARTRGRWQSVAGSKLLDAERSDPALRSFFVPYLSAQAVRFGSFNLYKRIMEDPEGEEPSRDV